MLVIRKKLFISSLFVTTCAVTALSAGAHLAKAAAVAAPNASLSTAGAYISGDNKLLLSGKVDAPLSDKLGAQLDGSDAWGQGINRGAVAAHVFGRNSKGLVGVTSLWGRIGAQNVYRAGLEGESYFNDKLSFYLGGGWQHGDSWTGKGTYSTYYTDVKGSYYINRNLVLSLTGNAFSNIRIGGGEAEWKPGREPYSLFAAGGYASTHNGYGMLGVRYTFGDNGATLEERDRNYDPPDNASGFASGGSSGIGAPHVTLPPVG